MNVKSIAAFGCQCRLNCGTLEFTPIRIIFLATRPKRMFDWGALWSSPVARLAHNQKVVGSNPTSASNFMATLANRRIMQMTLTPAEVGKACALYVAARCGEALPGKTKVRMDYWFDRDGRQFVGAKARVEVL